MYSRTIIKGVVSYIFYCVTESCVYYTILYVSSGMYLYSALHL